jgi:ribosome-binding protein aMBF1 (putative translation factor)
MIRNEAEYQEASKRLIAESRRLDEHRVRLKEAGLKEHEIQRVIDPLETFHLQLREEVEAYERLKRGEFEDLENLRGLGLVLITSRIAQGLSQRDLARRLGVHESQVSRDERNEYFGITLERAMKILEALNVRLRTHVQMDPIEPSQIA